MTSQIASAPEHAAIEVNPRARFEILGAILLALFLGALDQTIVGPVLPKISTELNGADFYTWVVTAYLVTSTAAIPIYGKLSDYFGRKPMLLIGIVLFLIGSILSGLSQTMTQLIIFRGIQGLGAGALFPISLAVIGDLFTPAERGKYQGLFGAVFGVAFLVGPFLGGALTDTVGWHYIFYVNVPVGLVSLYLIGRLLPRVTPKDRKFTLDILGVATFVGGIVPVLVALTLAETSPWTDPYVLAWFGVGLAFTLVFILVEWKAQDPMIPLDLFKNRTFAVSVVATFFAVFGFSILIIFLPLWFQIVQGASTTASGYLLFPFLFGLIFSSILAGQVVSRTGKYKWLLAGAIALMALGLFLFQGLRADTGNLPLWSWMFITGLGVGPTMAIFTLIVQNDVPFERLGTATSDLTLFRQIGTSVGLTVAFTLFRNYLNWDLLSTSVNNALPAGAPAQAKLPAIAPTGFDLGSLTEVGGTSPVSAMLTQVPAQFQAAYINGFHQAFSIAIADSVWIGVAAAVLSLVAVLALKEIPLRAHFHAEAHERSGLASAAGSSAAGSSAAGSSAAGSSTAGAAE
jgi:EmrB/QacA subfamily drug resistance transporter